MEFSMLKKEARFAIKEHFGTVIGTMLLFVAISIMFGLLINQNIIVTEDGSRMLTFGGVILTTIMILTELLLAAGITNTIVKISSNQKCGPTEFINFSVKNIFKIFAIYFRMFIKALLITVALFIVLLIVFAILISVFNMPNAILRIISLVASIIILILLALTLLPYSFCFIILSESPNEKTTDIIKASKTLFKGHAIDFILVLFTFIGWFILFFSINYFAYFFAAIKVLPVIIYELLQYLPTLFITPYIIATQYAFFEDVYAEKKVPTKTEENN